MILALGSLFLSRTRINSDRLRRQQHVHMIRHHRRRVQNPSLRMPKTATRQDHRAFLDIKMLPASSGKRQKISGPALFPVRQPLLAPMLQRLTNRFHSDIKNFPEWCAACPASSGMTHPQTIWKKVLDRYLFSRELTPLKSYVGGLLPKSIFSLFDDDFA